MKVNISSKKSKTAKRASQPKQARKINKDNFDRHAMIVGTRMPISKVYNAVRGRELGETLTKKAFLVTSGPNGTYLAEVRWDGKDLYSRDAAKGGKVYNSLKALNETGKEGFTATICNSRTLVELATETGKVNTVRHVVEDADMTVALLNSFGDRFVAGITRTEEGSLAAITMEHPSSNNTAKVQYDKPREVRKAKAFLASLVA